MSEMPTESVRSWAAESVAAGAKIAAAKAL